MPYFADVSTSCFSNDFVKLSPIDGVDADSPSSDSEDLEGTNGPKPYTLMYVAAIAELYNTSSP
jgi:hypothetical protein